ncbi:hypothetical protein [Polyangium sp. y55x31]|uniref:hypothetical protein n=1 Tax=Polyangium sp. y55x31 TaxID=3042688 RepID=UPI0024832C6F|nr:hypothetical protein [Polyangium sp. y55x31]MDI1478090.1 hypothetical protein [Polyangium sp. y55x31]
MPPTQSSTSPDDLVAGCHALVDPPDDPACPLDVIVDPARRLRRPIPTTSPTLAVDFVLNHAHPSTARFL